MAAQNQPTQQQQPNNGPPAPPGGIGGGGGGNGGGNGNNPNNANPNGQNNGGAGAGAAGGVAGGVAGGAGAGAAAAAAAAVPPVATGPVSASGAVINPNVDTVQPDCIAWRPNPAGATDGGRWVLGCVQAAAGYQCGPAAAFSAVPTCSIKNWNPNCANQPWLLPRVGTVTERVPIYGCISEEAIPKGYLCPSTHDVMPSGTTDPAMLVSGNITTACTVAATASTKPSGGGGSSGGSVSAGAGVGSSSGGGTAQSIATDTETTSAANTVLFHAQFLSLWLVLLALLLRSA